MLFLANGEATGWRWRPHSTLSGSSGQDLPTRGQEWLPSAGWALTLGPHAGRVMGGTREYRTCPRTPAEHRQERLLSSVLSHVEKRSEAYKNRSVKQREIRLRGTRPFQYGENRDAHIHPLVASVSAHREAPPEPVHTYQGCWRSDRTRTITSFMVAGLLRRERTRC
jgi:hypothetical protein